MGICSGSDNLLSATRSMKLIKSLTAGGVKIYDTNHNILCTLAGTSLQISVMVPNELIVQVGGRPDPAPPLLLEDPHPLRSIIMPLLQFLNQTKSSFLDEYPYFSWTADPDHINRRPGSSSWTHMPTREERKEE